MVRALSVCKIFLLSLRGSSDRNSCFGGQRATHAGPCQPWGKDFHVLNTSLLMSSSTGTINRKLPPTDHGWRARIVSWVCTIGRQNRVFKIKFSRKYWITAKASCYSAWTMDTACLMLCLCSECAPTMMLHVQGRRLTESVERLQTRWCIKLTQNALNSMTNDSPKHFSSISLSTGWSTHVNPEHKSVCEYQSNFVSNWLFHQEWNKRSSAQSNCKCEVPGCLLWWSWFFFFLLVHHVRKPKSKKLHCLHLVAKEFYI